MVNCTLSVSAFGQHLVASLYIYVVNLLFLEIKISSSCISCISIEFFQQFLVRQFKSKNQVHHKQQVKYTNFIDLQDKIFKTNFFPSLWTGQNSENHFLRKNVNLRCSNTPQAFVLETKRKIMSCEVNDHLQL